MDVDARHLALGLPVVLVSPGGVWLTGKTHPGLGLLPPHLGIRWSSAGSQVLAEMPGSRRGHRAAEVRGGGPTAWQGLVSAGAWSEADFSNMMSTHSPAPGHQVTTWSCPQAIVSPHSPVPKPLNHHMVLSPGHRVTTWSFSLAMMSPHNLIPGSPCHYMVPSPGHHVTMWSYPQDYHVIMRSCVQAIVSPCGHVLRGNYITT